jgi:hypothetical protein
VKEFKAFAFWTKADVTDLQKNFLIIMPPCATLNRILYAGLTLWALFQRD